MHGGHLAPDSVRLAHRVCNQRDYEWRKRINAMLAQRMSLDTIAEQLNTKKGPTIHGTNSRRAASLPVGRHSFHTPDCREPRE